MPVVRLHGGTLSQAAPQLHRRKSDRGDKAAGLSPICNNPDHDMANTRDRQDDARDPAARPLRHFSSTSSSAMVGWIATVASNCALVSPALTATAAPWRISGASGPIMWMPTT